VIETIHSLPSIVKQLENGPRDKF